ncbi:MAG: glycosyltransferase [Desulfovibrio sp.]|jgi:tetratricopeptide (TPR) repeat protein|nr:glycosyltransferase [Desulfovibrio sp.]
MKIVFQGQFLQEGLQKLGHEIHAIELLNSPDVNEQIRAVCARPDLVIIELFGRHELPLNFYDCRWKTVAYCVDSSINEYYLSEWLHLFDWAFVDQKSSVKSLQAYGVNATWLPLCVSEKFFREQRLKRHDISFVGRIDDYRKKRANLLKFLRSHYQINVVSGVPVETMQDIFAESRIVLNENLFSGLTLRVLQGMAAGSLVLTESGGDGVENYFQDGRHLVCFEPDSLLAIISDILENFEKYNAVALRGQQECLARHTSRARAQELLAAIERRPAGSKCLNSRKFYLANGLYNLRRRFGGDYSPSVRLFHELLPEQDASSARAAFILGNIHARKGRQDKAVNFYLAAIAKGFDVFPHLKLAMLFLQSNDTAGAVNMLKAALASVPFPFRKLPAHFESGGEQNDLTAAILLRISKVYYVRNMVFQVGFLQQRADYFPDTALEIARLAWLRRPSASILAFMLLCAKKCNISGELLPFLLQGAREGFAAQGQIRKARGLAGIYYDQAAQEELAGYLTG